MKAILVLLATVAFVGCTAPNAEVSHSPGAQPPQASASPQEFSAHGTYWMPTTVGPDPMIGGLPFSANASGRHVKVTLHLGMREAGVESPISPARAMVRLVDSANATLAQAMLMPQQQDATMEVAQLNSTAFQLVFETHGGSDGGSSGDHVDYVIETAPRQA